MKPDEPVATAAPRRRRDNPPNGTATLCDDGEQHRWQPLSFVFETQLLDREGRVVVRQPEVDAGRVYAVCMTCRQHTYITTEWVGYTLGGPGE